jgi:transcriptional regulator with XRE-family HTH domain
MMAKKSPEVERTPRLAIGKSQMAHAEKLGVTFQQMQKYKKGVNRVGSSRLCEAAVRIVLLLAMTVLFVLCTPRPAEATDYICKEIGQEWVWLSDNVAMSVEYLIIGVSGRKYDVGTGVFFRGQPWGSVSGHEGKSEVTAYGVGALHVKQADQGPPFKVCATTSKLAAITIITVEF